MQTAIAISAMIALLGMGLALITISICAIHDEFFKKGEQNGN